MPDFFEYDPVTGIKTETAWDENTQQMTLIRTSDVQPIVDYSKAQAADPDLSRRGIKENWWLYANIPPIVVLQLRAKGINLFDKADLKRAIEEINTNYPHLKATVGKMEGKVKSYFNA